MRDSEAPGLRVRVTAAGAKSFVYEAKLNRQTIRRTIGDVKLWSIEQARTEARRLAVALDNGQDPRELERQQQADKAAAKAAATAKALTVGEVWPLYLENGKPKRRDAWKPRYRADLEAMAAPGGEKKKRGEGTTRPGPLYPLLALPLAGVNEDTLKSWYDREAMAGKHQAARALMMFRGFLRWCAARPEYRSLTDRDAGKAAAIMESLPSNTRRTDALEAAQVPGWWAGVEQLSNRTASAYLRALLLTGARREELAALTWGNVDFQVAQADHCRQDRQLPNHSPKPLRCANAGDAPKGGSVRVRQHGQGRADYRLPCQPCQGTAKRGNRGPDHPRAAPLLFAAWRGCWGSCWGYRASDGPQAKRNSRGIQTPQHRRPAPVCGANRSAHSGPC